MKFKRLFFDNYIKLENISKRDLVLCIVIGLLSSFAIYSAFYVLRETFRLMTSLYGLDTLIFSEKDRWLSNLFYAYLSLIFGNSLSISFLFKKPQKLLSRKNNKRLRILNDQVFLNFNFMYWFGGFAISFGVMTVGMINIEFVPKYYISFILLILVLYLEVWKNLLRIIKRKKHVYMFFHFIILSCLAFGLSKIDILDYKSYDESILEKNPIINLPKSFYHDNEKKYRRSHPIVHFKLFTDKNNNLVIIDENYKKWRLKDVRALMFEERERVAEELISRMLVLISANKEIKLKHIKALEAEIYTIGQRRVRYEVIDREIKPNRFIFLGFNKRLYKSTLDYKVDLGINLPSPNPGPPPPPEYLEGRKFNDTIEIFIGNTIKLNNNEFIENNLVALFEKEIDRNTLFLYKLNDETSHQNYITVLSAQFKAIHNLRQKNTDFDILKERYDFSETEKEELNRIIDRFPTIYKEEYLKKVN